MRFPIRSQILLPLAALQVAVVTLVSAWAAWGAAGRVREDVAERLNALGAMLETAAYPITGSVLRQMKQLSGADYVLLSPEGNLIETTLALPRPTGAPDEIIPEDLRTAGTLAEIEISGVAYRGLWVDAGRVSATGQRVLILYPDAEVQVLRREAIAGPLLTGGLILTLTILATTWVAHRMGRRMQRVQQQVARIASGEFEPLSISERDDEIRDLSLLVNRMGEALQALTASIRNAERAQLTTQVVGGFAHQLRNAMTGIRMAIQVHRRRCGTADEASLGVALAQLAFTEQQIRGLLGLARGEERPPVPGNVSKLLHEIASMVEPLCEHRRIAWTYRADCGADLSVSDADAFRSAVLNLCMNGIEAGGTPGELALWAGERGGQIIVEVQDNGQGVPDEIREAIFAPYFTTKPEGIGLGLALTRRAAENLGGTVSVERRQCRTVFSFVCIVSECRSSGDPAAQVDPGCTPHDVRDAARRHEISDFRELASQSAR